MCRWVLNVFSLWGWRFHCLSGPPASVLDQPHSESFFCLNVVACGFGCACFVLFFHWAPEKSLASSSLLSLLCHMGMHLVCGQLVHWESQVLLCKSILPASCLPTTASNKSRGRAKQKGRKKRKWQREKSRRCGGRWVGVCRGMQASGDIMLVAAGWFTSAPLQCYWGKTTCQSTSAFMPGNLSRI